MEKINIVYKCRREELMYLPLDNYKVVIDLEKDNIVVTNERMRKTWKKIAEISVKNDTKKARVIAADKVKETVFKLKMVCKTTVAKTYGKKIAENAAVWRYCDNPHDSRDYMYLYLDDYIQYFANKCA